MSMNDSAPEGWEGTVLAMKSHPEIDNPFALANWMKSQGMQPHDAYDSAKLDGAIKSYREKIADPEPENESDEDFLEDGTPYTQGQPRGAEPAPNVDLLQEEDVEPYEHVPAETEDDDSILMGEDPGKDGDVHPSHRGHPMYGGKPEANTPGLVDHDGGMGEMAGGEQEHEGEQPTEDDQFSEIEAMLKGEEETAEEGAPVSQPNPGEAVSAKPAGTSSGEIEDPEAEEPPEPDHREGPPVGPK